MASTADSHKAPDTIDFNWQRSGNKSLRGTKKGSSLHSQTVFDLRKMKPVTPRWSTIWKW